MFKYCDHYKFLLHPEKFYPFATQVISIGIKRMMYGSALTNIYIKKVLALPKPHLTEKLRSAIGVFIYIARYLFRFSYFIY